MQKQEESRSPIRTRREIVSGKYGIVECDKYGRIGIAVGQHSVSELREAAHLFNQIAEVLEENAG